MRLRGLLPFLIFLGAWTLAGATTDLPRLLLPTPADVYQNAIELIRNGVLIDATISSLVRFSVGLGAGTALGIILGMLLGLSERVSASFGPTIKFFQSISGVVWIPLTVLWFGIGNLASIFIIFNTALFVVLYNINASVRALDRNLVWGLRTLGGGHVALIRHVVFPGTVPYLLGALRVAIGYGWRALIAAEIVAGGDGLGVLIWNGQQQLDSSDVLVGLIVIGIVSYVMNKSLLPPLEKQTIQKWGIGAGGQRRDAL